MEVKIDWMDILDHLISLILTIWYLQTKHWIASNLFGFAFCVQGIALLNLGSYKVGAILLGGLFVYDIFWVFGTDVMVTVAKSFEAPIKLLFPKNIWAETYSFSMLGLGDIVIPGIFIALLLRFDYFQANKLKKNANKIYFRVCFLFYIIGLVTTIFVMHTFQAAQPALLYLVPACLGSSFILSILRGETNDFFLIRRKINHQHQQQQIQMENKRNKINWIVRDKRIIIKKKNS